MNKETLTEVEREVKRFVERLETVKKSEDYKAEHSYFFGSPETAALKRSSMDLSRALSRLRK